MAIQNRRGKNADFDASKMLPGEFAFTTDGTRKVFAAFVPGDAKEVAFKEDLPVKTSDLTNDDGFITKTVTDLINYYTKSETYTQEEIKQLVSTIPKFSIQPVKALPTEDISTTTVYLLTTGEESQNLYTEYFYVDGNWEKLGTQKLDLSGYALKTDIPTRLSELINDTEFITVAVDNLVNYYTKQEVEGKLYIKANSILSRSSGTTVSVTDSANTRPKNIKLFGKGKQRQYEGNQLFDASVMNGKESDNCSVVNNGDGTFTIRGSGKLSETFNCAYVSHDLHTRFKVGALNLNNENDSYPCFHLYGTDAEGKTLFTLLHNGSVYITQDIITNLHKVIFSVYGSTGYDVSPATIKPMLYQDGDGTWEPFVGNEPSPSMKYPQKPEFLGESGSIVGKVLAENFITYPYITESGTTIRGVECTHNIDGVIRLNGNSEANSEFKLWKGTLQKGTYTLSWLQSSENTRIYMYKDGQLMASRSASDKVHSFDSDGSGEYSVNVLVLKNKTFTNEVVKVQLQLGSEATEIKPPSTEQPFTALTPNGLKGVPLGQTIPDVIKNSPIHMSGVYWDSVEQQYYIADTENENGKDVQRIVEYVVDGTTAITTYDANGSHSGFAIYNVIPEVMNRRQGYCNQLRVVTSGAITKDGLWIGVNNQVVYAINNSFFDASLEDYGLANFTAHLKENPLVITTWTDEPIVTDLTTEETESFNALHMNYPNTTIVNDAGAYMEVEYVADTKKHIEQNYVSKTMHEEHESRIAELEKAIVNS